MERLRQRAEFLAAAAGAKTAARAFLLQTRVRGDQDPPRVGFTVSRKVGTAVERNRVRRRLKEAVRRFSENSMRRGHDYVVVGRRAALGLPFLQLIADLENALDRLHILPGPDDMRGKAGRDQKSGPQAR